MDAEGRHRESYSERMAVTGQTRLPDMGSPASGLERERSQGERPNQGTETRGDSGHGREGKRRVHMSLEKF